MVNNNAANHGRLTSDSRPVPDPTALTDTAIAKANSALREVLNARIAGIEATNAHFQKWFDTIPVTTTALTVCEGQIKGLTEAAAVFKQTVNERFQLGDVQTEKAARDVKSAVDAAFAAAKEAVGEQNKSNALSITKSENATTKQIDQLTENFKASSKTTDDKIESVKKNADDKLNDLKDRILAMESRAKGLGDGWGWIAGAVGLLAVVANTIVMISRH